MKLTRLLDEGLGTLIGGDNYAYCALWSEIKKEQKRRKVVGGDDVRVADFVLRQIGIPSVRTFADYDEKGRWVIYWY